jgi:phage terminase small subunit
MATHQKAQKTRRFQQSTRTVAPLVAPKIQSGEKMGLTPKQTRFVEEYLIDLNATQAAIRAGYSSKNADKIGSRLLGKSRVSAAIAAAQEARSARTAITADGVLQRLWQEATRVGDGSSHSARVSALGILAKHFGLLEPKKPQTVAVDVTSGGKPLERSCLTAEDVAAAAALVREAGIVAEPSLTPEWN